MRVITVALLKRELHDVIHAATKPNGRRRGKLAIVSNADLGRINEAVQQYLLNIVNGPAERNRDGK